MAKKLNNTLLYAAIGFGFGYWLRNNEVFQSVTFQQPIAGIGGPKYPPNSSLPLSHSEYKELTGIHSDPGELRNIVIGDRVVFYYRTDPKRQMWEHSQLLSEVLEFMLARRAMKN